MSPIGRIAVLWLFLVLSSSTAHPRDMTHDVVSLLLDASRVPQSDAETAEHVAEIERRSLPENPADLQYELDHAVAQQRMYELVATRPKDEDNFGGLSSDARQESDAIRELLRKMREELESKKKWDPVQDRAKLLKIIRGGRQSLPTYYKWPSVGTESIHEGMSVGSSDLEVYKRCSEELLNLDEDFPEIADWTARLIKPFLRRPDWAVCKLLAVCCRHIST